MTDGSPTSCLVINVTNRLLRVELSNIIPSSIRVHDVMSGTLVVSDDIS